MLVKHKVMLDLIVVMLIIRSWIRLDRVKDEWDKRYRSQKLFNFKPGQSVHVKALTNVENHGIVLKEDKAPNKLLD